MLKRFIPRPIKQKLKKTLQQRALDRTLTEIAQLSPEIPPTSLLERLQTAWDNEGMAAQTSYLREVAQHAATTSGPVLECGSGLTTLVVGLLAGRREVDLWTLEHYADWHRRVSETLARNNVTRVNNCLAELKDYGDFAWYDAPLEKLPKKFSLVICDGPPGSTKGGRYGLVPVLKDRLAPGTIILLDDAHREEEAVALERWQKLLELSVSFHEETRGKYAVITVLGLRDKPK